MPFSFWVVSLCTVILHSISWLKTFYQHLAAVFWTLLHCLSYMTLPKLYFSAITLRFIFYFFLGVFFCLFFCTLGPPGHQLSDSERRELVATAASVFVAAQIRSQRFLGNLR